MSQNSISTQQPQNMKKKRNGYGNPDRDAIVIALSVKSIISEIRYVCEICNKEFPRDQNLQLHGQGHNIPCNLMQRTKEIKKKVYICPEPSCEYHQPSRALTGITAIKKHYFRKHGDKKWKCENCPKSYSVQSDLKAHLKKCESNSYKCECGTLISRKDSLTAHKGYCKALPEGSDRLTATNPNNYTTPLPTIHPPPPPPLPSSIQVPFSWVPPPQNHSPNFLMNIPQLSATAPASHASSTSDMDVTTTWQTDDLFTRLMGDKRPGVGGSGSGSGGGSEVGLEQCGGDGGSDSRNDMDQDLSSIWDYLDIDLTDI